MDDQKIENLLNLSMEATEEEREKSLNLDAGYDEQTGRWEVIIRYNGELGAIMEESWDVVELSGGYAIVTLPQADIERLSRIPQIEYIEKPKRLFF